MTNETLINQHLDAIKMVTPYQMVNDEDPIELAGTERAAHACAAITVEHMKGFSIGASKTDGSIS